MKYKLKIRYIVLCTLLLVVWTTQFIPAMGKIYAHSVYPVIAYILSSFSRLIPFAIGDLFIALSIAGVLLYPAYASGILHEMQKKCPQTTFIPAPPNDSTCACNECSFMRLNTLEKLYNCLKDESPEITVDPEIAEKAVKPIKRMLEISAKLGL